MPDRDHQLDLQLDRGLVNAREELLSDIRIPEIDTVRARSGAIRRRRQSVAAAAAVVLVAAGLGTAVLNGGPTTPDPATVATNSPDPLNWQGGGLTVLGLNGSVLEVPGELYDVQFADPSHGYALARDCVGNVCTISFTSTTDGGKTWSLAVAPPRNTARPDALPSLHPIGEAGVAVVEGKETFFLRYGTQQWKPGTTTNAPVAQTVPDGGQVWLPSMVDGSCTSQAVSAWRPDGTLVRLAHQPQLQVCWAEAAATADGAWWVGGRVGDTPAVAVSRDDGASWTVSTLPSVPGVPDAWAQVTTMGNQTFASVVSPEANNRLRVHAVLLSAGGGPFTSYATNLGMLIGELVPLLDGRLVATDSQWLVSHGEGATLKPAGGNLPSVGRIASTPGAYVAYNIFGGGWVAVSTTGSTWQKINLH